MCSLPQVGIWLNIYRTAPGIRYLCCLSYQRIIIGPVIGAEYLVYVCRYQAYGDYTIVLCNVVIGIVLLLYPFVYIYRQVLLLPLFIFRLHAFLPSFSHSFLKTSFLHFFSISSVSLVSLKAK